MVSALCANVRAAGHEQAADVAGGALDSRRQVHSFIRVDGALDLAAGHRRLPARAETPKAAAGLSRDPSACRRRTTASTHTTSSPRSGSAVFSKGDELNRQIQEKGGGDPPFAFEEQDAPVIEAQQRIIDNVRRPRWTRSSWPSMWARSRYKQVLKQLITRGTGALIEPKAGKKR